jgi:hypothetical protein
MDLTEVKSNSVDGKEVVVYLKRPGPKEYRDAQIAYNKAFREALESGAMLKAKLADHVRAQGVWDDTKEAQYKKYVEDIRGYEAVLSTGGIKLSEAKEAALKLRNARADFQALISERNSYESNCAESLADNLRFNQLVVSCTLSVDKHNRVWASLDDYDKNSFEPWAVEAASKLANMLYGLDPDYEKNLPENKFLVTYKFADKDLNLINKDGHLVDLDGRLIDEEGYYIKYVDGKKVRITLDGKELDENNNIKTEFSPFLDDEGNPVEV